MARTYKRDSRGRFAGGGGSSSRGGGRKPMQRGTNRLTRDNAGRITGVGGDGATARGGRLRTASGKQRATVTAKGIGKAPAGTVGRSGRVKGAARVKAAAAVKPARRRSRAASITPDKTKRITERINRVTAASSTKTGIKRLNSTEVSVRAKAFVTRKVGGMSGLQGKTFEQQQAAVKAALAKPNRYSTQKPNRNKPERYNNLGQSSLRRKAAAANKVAAGGSIGEGSRMAAQVNRSASIAASKAPSAPRLATRSAGPSAPNNARTRANRLRTMQARVRFNRSEPDSVSMSRAVTARNAALQARVPGAPGKVVFRGKNRAANRQNYRANDLTTRIRRDLQYSRPGAFSATAGGGRVGIRRTDTGNRQLAMFGQPAAKLMRTKRVKVNRPSGKSRR